MKKILKLTATIFIVCLALFIFVGCDSKSDARGILNEETTVETPPAETTTDTPTTTPDTNTPTEDFSCQPDCPCHCAHDWVAWETFIHDREVIQIYYCRENHAHIKLEVIETLPELTPEPTFEITIENIAETTWYDEARGMTLTFKRDYTLVIGDLNGKWSIDASGNIHLQVIADTFQANAVLSYRDGVLNCEDFFGSSCAFILLEEGLY